MLVMVMDLRTYVRTLGRYLWRKACRLAKPNAAFRPLRARARREGAPSLVAPARARLLPAFIAKWPTCMHVAIQ